MNAPLGSINLIPAVDYRGQRAPEIDKLVAASIAPKEQGRKFDIGKLRWSLLPSGVIRLIVEVLEIGAQKYDVDNWKFVPEARTRYYDALNRHVEAWWNGEKLDSESGKHHLAHAGCCLFFLLWLDTNTKS